MGKKQGSRGSGKAVGDLDLQSKRICDTCGKGRGDIWERRGWGYKWDQIGPKERQQPDPTGNTNKTGPCFPKPENLIPKARAAQLKIQLEFHFVQEAKNSREQRSGFSLCLLASPMLLPFHILIGTWGHLTLPHGLSFSIW